MRASRAIVKRISEPAISAASQGFRPDDGSMMRRDREFVARSVAVALSAFGARLFFVLYSGFMGGDAFTYDAIARNIVSGRGFAIDPASPTVFVPPIYPLFLASIYALFGAVPGLAMFVQAALGAFSAWAVYLVGRRLLGDPSAFIGALCAAVYPQLAWFSDLLVTESVTFFLMSSAMLASSALLRRRPWLSSGVAGALFALATLSSPRLALLPIGLPIVDLLRYRSWRRAACLGATIALGYVIVLTPWVARNALEFGRFIPLTVGTQGITFWDGTANKPLYKFPYREWAQTEPLVARFVYHYIDNPGLERELIDDRIQLERDFDAAALRNIATDPVGYLGNRVRQVPFLWVQPAAFAGHLRPPFVAQNVNLSTMLEQRDWSAAAMRVFTILAFTVAFYALFVLGAWTTRRRWREISLLYMPAIYVAIVQTPQLIDQRYSVFSHPYLWLVAGAGMVSLWSRRRRSA